MQINLNRLHAESLVNQKNRPEKNTNPTKQGQKIIRINLISLNYTLQHKAGYSLVHSYNCT